MTCRHPSIFASAGLLALAACSTPEQRAREAEAQAAESAAEASRLQAEYQQKRLERIEAYEACVEAAEPDNIHDCDRILRTIEAMQ